MKIRTWIKYEESYLPPRCRKPRYAEKEAYVNATLREASKDSLRLAFTIADCNGDYQLWYEPKTKRLWRKATMNSVCAGDPTKDYQTPLEALQWWNAHGSKFFLLSYNRERCGMDTSFTTCQKEIRSYMRQFLLVDGELWVQQAGIPCYYVRCFGSGNNHGGTGLFVGYLQGKWHNFEPCADALHGADAVAYATQVALGRGDTKSVPLFRERIQVHMPELVKPIESALNAGKRS